MSEWEIIKFKNFIKLNRGFDLPNDKMELGDFPVVASTNIKGYHNKYKIEPPCVVTGRSGSLGTVQYIEEKCTPLNTTLYVKDFKGNNPKFVYYYLKTMHLEQFNSGAGVPTLNQNHLHSYGVYIPNLPTQKRIAEVLSAYDDLIENNNKRIALLEKAAQELYKEWFVRFRFPDYENVKLKDSALGQIPENFDVVKICDVLSYYIGGGWGEDDESTSSSCDAYVIRGTDFPKIKNGDWSTCPYRYHKKSNYEARKLEPWDIVLEVSGGTQEQPVGRTLIVTPDLLKALFNKVICASFCKQLRCDDNVISPIYYYYWMQFLYDTRIIDKFQLQSTGIINFKFEYFHRKGDVLLPPKHIMDEFDNRVKQIFKLKDDLALKNRNLIKQRDLLLPRLMSGKLEVDVESINKGKETNKIISFEQFKQEFKFAARADNALSDDDVKNLYEAYCNDKCKKE